VPFYLRYGSELARKLLRFGAMYRQYRSVLRRVQRDALPYTDTAMTLVDVGDVDQLELFCGFR
jgi:hypothetical protein